MGRVVLALVAVAGCARDYDLTCKLLNDPSNCFAQQAAALAACIPMSATATGTLSADQKTCTFPDGVYITFAQAFPRTCLYQPDGLHLSVHNPDGSVCGGLYYVESSSGPIIGLSQSVGWEPEDEGLTTVLLRCPTHTYAARIEDVDSCGPYVALSGTEVVIAQGDPRSSTRLFTCLPP